MLAWGPHRIGWKLGIARSTVYAVLRRAGLHRLAWLHRTTREIVRYEHPVLARWFTWISRNSGASRRVAASASCPGSQRLAVALSAALASVRLRPRSRGRPLPLCLRRGLAGRTRRERCCFPGPGACPLRTPRFHGRARPDRQRRLLREPHLHLYGGGTKPAVEAHAALPAQTNGKAEAFNKIMQAEWPTSGRTLPTASGSKRCLASLRITITAVHTAASAGPLPHPGCKQRPGNYN